MMNAIVTRGRTSLTLGIILPTALSSACGKENSEAVHPGSPAQVFLAQPCEELERVSSGAPVAVFLQVANVQSPLAEPLGDYLRANAVQANQVASMLVRLGKPAVGPWSACSEDGATEQTGTIEAGVLGPDYSRIELIVAVPGVNPERVLVPITDQTPLVVPLTLRGTSGGSVVVTPYLIRAPEQQGLRTLYDCKVQSHV